MLPEVRLVRFQPTQPTHLSLFALLACLHFPAIWFAITYIREKVTVTYMQAARCVPGFRCAGALPIVLPIGLSIWRGSKSSALACRGNQLSFISLVSFSFPKFSLVSLLWIILCLLCAFLCIISYQYQPCERNCHPQENRWGQLLENEWQQLSERESASEQASSWFWC